MGLFFLRHCGVRSYQNVVPQDVQNQTLPRQEAKAEQANPSVDQNEDWQQDQVQLQEETLEENQAGPVSLCSSASSASPTRPEHHLLGPHHLESKTCYVERQTFCTDSLVIVVTTIKV